MTQQQDFAYINALKKIFKTHPQYRSHQIIDEAVNEIFDRIILPKDRQLLKIAFNPDVEQKDLDDFLEEWDIETVGLHQAIIVAYTMKMHPKLKFDAYTGPRLKGILNYLRFQNLELISHFSKITRRLNQENIFPLIIKGSVMRYLRPDLPRVMGDIDILLPSEQHLERTKKCVQELGYICSDAGHSIDVHPKDDLQKGILDMHRFFGFLPQTNPKINAQIFKRATLQKVFSAKAYVPQNEDMVFICLNNLAANLRNSTSVQGIAQNMFDLVYLTKAKPDFDWNIVVQDILTTKTEASIYLAMQFVNKIVPDIFAHNLISEEQFYKALENFINYEKFYSLYVHDVKMACKKLKLAKSIRNLQDFKTYIAFKGQHFFTKRILKHPTLINLFLKYRSK